MPRPASASLAAQMTPVRSLTRPRPSSPSTAFRQPGGGPAGIVADIYLAGNPGNIGAIRDIIAPAPVVVDEYWVSGTSQVGSDTEDAKFPGVDLPTGTWTRVTLDVFNTGREVSATVENVVIEPHPEIAIYCGEGPLAETYWQDFEFADGTTDLGDGSVIASNDGINQVVGGALRMTQSGVNSSNAYFWVPALPGADTLGWSAHFDFTLAHEGANTPADGFSFNYGAVPDGGAFGGPAEEGLNDAIDHVSYEIDSWLWDAADRDAGVGINTDGVDPGANGEGALAYNRATGDTANFTPNSSVSASAWLSWDPVNGASFTTEGLGVNADFVDVAIPDFTPDGTYSFNIAARTGGHNETVTIDNLHIVTGGRTPVPNGSTDPFDFGILCSGETATKAYTIENSGDADLVFTDLSLPPDFSLVDGGVASVAPGESAVVQLQFAPTGAAGPRGGTVSVSSNDHDENPYTFQVSGYHDTPPVISAKNVVVNAPEGGLSEPVSYMVTVTDNDDGATLDCTPPDGTQFPVGSHEVLCTATDINGCTSQSSFWVIVLAIQPSGGERALDIVSLRGEIAPGGGPGTGIPEGAAILNHDAAYINNSGAAIVQASFSGGGSALYNGDVGGLTSLIAARGGDNDTGGTYGTFSNLAVAEDGGTGFQSASSNGNAGYVGGATAIQVGGAAPDTNGGVVAQIHPSALADGGLAYTPARLDRDGGENTVFNDTGIWSSLTGKVVREGDPVDQGPVSIGQVFPRVVTNSAGVPAWATNLSGNGGANSAVLVGADPVALKGDAAPGVPGALLNGFQAESISEAGTIVFRASLRLSAGIVDVSNNSGLWTNRNGELELIAREGSPAPCIEDDVQFEQLP